LSAADATAHIIGNPFVPKSFNHPVLFTLVLLVLLCAIFLKGFKEAIGLAVVIVAVYLALNVIVIGTALLQVVQHPEVFPAWKAAVLRQHGSGIAMVGGALLLCPTRAPGVCGCEAGGGGMARGAGGA